MKLSTKSRYGARALVEIARHAGSLPIKRKDIVENQGIPDSYLENILISLKNADLIQTVRGAKGGYTLSRAASNISLLDVVEALEGAIRLVDCEKAGERCDRWNTCGTREVWQEMEEAQRTVLRRHTIGSLVGKLEAGYTLDWVI